MKRLLTFSFILLLMIFSSAAQAQWTSMQLNKSPGVQNSNCLYRLAFLRAGSPNQVFLSLMSLDQDIAVGHTATGQTFHFFAAPYEISSLYLAGAVVNLNDYIYYAGLFDAASTSRAANERVSVQVQPNSVSAKVDYNLVPAAGNNQRGIIRLDSTNLRLERLCAVPAASPTPYYLQNQ